MLSDLPVKLVDLCGEFSVAGEHCAQLHECADDEDAHLDSFLTVKHGRGHDRAVFGEGIGQVPRVAMLL